MIYQEYPIKADDIVCQVADTMATPVYKYAAEGDREPKTDQDGNWQYEVQLMVTSGGRMSLEKLKVWAEPHKNPLNGIEAGEVVNLMQPTVYVGMQDSGKNAGQKFYGLKALAISKAGK